MDCEIVADLALGLVRKIVSLATEEIIQTWNLDEDLQTLREKWELVGAFLTDAAINKMSSLGVFGMWCNKVQAVAHVVDVLMDDLEYEVSRTKVENRPKVLDSFTFSIRNTLLFLPKVARKINFINTSLDKIFSHAIDLGLRSVVYSNLSSTVPRREMRSTPLFEDQSLIVGRDGDVSLLVNIMMCNKNEEDLHVNAILGMGGQGKTTLARMVYNKDTVIKMFPKRMWVTVSDDFDFMMILNQMVVSLTSMPSVLDNTEGLIQHLQEKLKGEKFLLVLDDVWNEKPEEWDKLRNSLLAVGGARGSSILVTTRRQEVIDAMQCCVCYRMKGLPVEESYALFRMIAFSDGGVLETEAFAALGRSMVERCGGLPLAIRELGGLLYSKKSEQQWLNIQNSETWRLRTILPSLRLSYDNLPNSSLKQCFVYLSIIPRDSVIYKDELVQIWTALGFISPFGGNVEDIGNEYFNILLSHSLLHDEERDEFGNIISCKMHDLVHDLAVDLSSHRSLSVESTTGYELKVNTGPIYLRLSKEISDLSTILEINFEKVQVLYTGARILGHVLQYLKHLTVLVLHTDEVTKELPILLRDMKYLKHLDISCFHSSLPSYIMELYSLQTLRLWVLPELRIDIHNLIKLRHLRVKKIAKTRCMIIGIERLFHLQTLPHFVVNRDQNCLIGQLGGLKNLRGSLDIYGLGGVTKKEESSKAKLWEKNFESLLLDWSNGSENEGYNHENVMEGLEPHPNLRELTIDNFMGKKFASWITMMTKLVKITLRDCNRCEELPPLGQLLHLREMEITKMDDVKVIGSSICDNKDANAVTTMYQSLIKLVMCDLPKLEKWVEPVMSRGCEDKSNVLAFPKLEVLNIKRCSKLTRIPSSGFLSLKRMIIQDLGSNIILEPMSRNITSLTDLQLSNIGDERGGGSSSFSSNMDSIIDELLKNSSLSLTTLKLNNCKGLTYLTLGAPLEKLEVSNCPDLTIIDVVEESLFLKYLTIKRCPSFSVLSFAQSLVFTLLELRLGPFSVELDEFPLPFSSFSSVILFPNLKRLELYGWEKVKSILPARQMNASLNDIFPALNHLRIDSFQGVESLPDSLTELTSLDTLHIWNCKHLRSFPDFNKFHSRLQHLEIGKCHPVLEERYRKRNGTEWSKIKHIPDIKWNREK